MNESGVIFVIRASLALTFCGRWQANCETYRSSSNDSRLISSCRAVSLSQSPFLLSAWRLRQSDSLFKSAIRWVGNIQIA